MPEGSSSVTRHRRLVHDRTTVLAGQRVMRHFLRAALGLRQPMPVPIEIALLAPRVLLSPPKAALIALPGTILCIWAVPSLARGVRRRLLPPSRRGRRRIVLSGSSVALPILLFRSEGRPPARPSPPQPQCLPAVDSRLALPDSRAVAAASRLSTAPTRPASNRQTGCYIVTPPWRSRLRSCGSFSAS